MAGILVRLGFGSWGWGCRWPLLERGVGNWMWHCVLVSSLSGLACVRHSTVPVKLNHDFSCPNVFCSAVLLDMKKFRNVIRDMLSLNCRESKYEVGTRYSCYLVEVLSILFLVGCGPIRFEIKFVILTRGCNMQNYVQITPNSNMWLHRLHSKSAIGKCLSYHSHSYFAFSNYWTSFRYRVRHDRTVLFCIFAYIQVYALKISDVTINTFTLGSLNRSEENTNCIRVIDKIEN